MFTRQIFDTRLSLLSQYGVHIVGRADRCQSKEYVNSQENMFIISKIISDGENNFTQNKCNKLQKISAKNKSFFKQNKCKSANIGSSTCSSITWRRPEGYFQFKQQNVNLHGLDMRDTYSISIIKVHCIWFYNMYKLYLVMVHFSHTKT